MNNPKEFTQDEFNRFVEKNNLEVFTKVQVDTFSKDVVEKSKNKEIDEFEITCCMADYMSLKPVFVRRNDLMKSLMFYREAQREPVEIPDGIFKSIDDRMCFCYKETPLNILKGIVGINCADDVAIEKAKALPLGTEKMYGGKMYVKTEKGWRLKGTGKKGLATDKEAQEKKFIENLVTAYKNHGKDSVQFQTAMLAPKNTYKDEKEINRFLGKLSAAIESETKESKKEDKKTSGSSSAKRPCQTNC
jgi:hypothetical protein